jgi:hypothetical protein
MKTDPPDSNSEFELRAQLLRLLKRETYRQRQQRLLVEENRAFLTLQQQVSLEQRIAHKLKHPSLGNLTWLQLRALKLWDEIDTLRKELNL